MMVEAASSGNLTDTPYDLFPRGLRWWSVAYRGKRRAAVLQARRREAVRIRNVQEPGLSSAASVENYDARLASPAVVFLRARSAHEWAVHPGSRRILARRVASFLYLRELCRLGGVPLRWISDR